MAIVGIIILIWVIVESIQIILAGPAESGIIFWQILELYLFMFIIFFLLSFIKDIYVVRKLKCRSEKEVEEKATRIINSLPWIDYSSEQSLFCYHTCYRNQVSSVDDFDWLLKFIELSGYDIYSDKQDISCRYQDFRYLTERVNRRYTVTKITRESLREFTKDQLAARGDLPMPRK